MKHLSQNNGFSLIELSIALIIIGLIAAPLFNYLTLYYEEKARRETLEHLNIASKALGQYFKETGHYPCPAPIDLGPEDSASGTAGTCVQRKNGAGGGVRSRSGCSNGLCRTQGNNLNRANVDQTVVIGALPYRVLGLTYQQALDGYNNKISYAVTERYTFPNYGHHLGAIGIEDIEGDSVVNPPGTAQFILVSHGEDGKGAYNESGNKSATACSPQDGIDSENCDLDAQFLDAPLATAPGRTFYDDKIMYKMFGDSLLWQVSPFNETNIYNSTKGNVGIGTDKPEDKLHVTGNIRATGNLNIAEICSNEKDGVCFRPDLIGGSGMRCNSENEAMIGIEESDVVCKPVRIENFDNQECNGDAFMAGIKTTGEIICRPPSWRVTPETTQNITP